VRERYGQRRPGPVRPAAPAAPYGPAAPPPGAYRRPPRARRRHPFLRKLLVLTVLVTGVYLVAGEVSRTIQMQVQDQVSRVWDSVKDEAQHIKDQVSSAAPGGGNGTRRQAAPDGGSNG
jgi:hypothetical protein